jgi:hypothetical protein
LGLEKPNSGLDPGETFFPNSVSDLDSAETFQISRNLGLNIDETVCLLDSQLCVRLSGQVTGTGVYKEDMGGQVSGMGGFVGGMGSYSKRNGEMLN